MTTEASMLGLSCGLDLHSSNVYATVLEAPGTPVYQKRLRTDLTEILTALKSFPALEHVTVESTYNWYWLVDGLIENGYTVHLANPAKLKDCAAPKFTDDRYDAKRLAWLLMHDQLPEGYIYPREIRPIRDLLRRRGTLSQQHTQSVLSLQSMVVRTTGKRVSGATIKKWDFRHIEEIFPDPNNQLAAQCILEMIWCQQKRLKKMEDHVLNHLKSLPDFQSLLQVPGIGNILGVTIALETGPIERFDGAAEYASYCRAVPSRRTSNEKSKGQNNRKNGNKHLGWAYIEAAHHAQIHYPRIHSWFDRKKRRTNRNVASKALAAKLAKAAFYVLRDEVDFDEQKLFA